MLRLERRFFADCSSAQELTESVELSARAEPREGDGVKQISWPRTIPGALCGGVIMH